MRQWINLLRVILIGFSVSFPNVVIGGALRGVRGAEVGLLLGFGIILFSALRAERVVKKVCRATSQTSPGIARTIELAMAKTNFAIPRVLVYADPFPNVLVVKSLGSKGSIFLSQGLIAQLNDFEIQAILGMCIESLNRPGVLLHSLSSSLALWILSFWPESWKNLMFPSQIKWRENKENLSPLSAIPLLILFPIALLFYKLGQIPAQKGPKNLSDENRAAALRKTNQTLRIWGLGGRWDPVSLFSLDLHV